MLRIGLPQRFLVTARRCAPSPLYDLTFSAVPRTPACGCPVSPMIGFRPVCTSSQAPGACSPAATHRLESAPASWSTDLEPCLRLARLRSGPAAAACPCCPGSLHARHPSTRTPESRPLGIVSWAGRLPESVSQEACAPRPIAHQDGSSLCSRSSNF